MTTLNLLLCLVGVVAGIAILLLALGVLIEVDLSAGGAWWGLAWFVAATLGGGLALQSMSAPPQVLTAGLAAVFAALGWRYRALLRMESRKPQQLAEQRQEP